MRARIVFVALLLAAASSASADSVARQWNEALLGAVRLDYPAPTVHSRNLFHLSAAMYDAWAAYDPQAQGYFVDEIAAATDVEAARAEAMSFAAFRILSARFKLNKCSPGAAAYATTTFPALMDTLGYDAEFIATSGGVNPAAELGNRIGAAILAAGLVDGSNEGPEGGLTPYSDATYVPVNPPMVVDLPGVTQPAKIDCAPGDPDPDCIAPELPFPNSWQRLSLDFLVLQNGIIVGEATQKYLGSAWGNVTPFAATRATVADVYHDQGPPPEIGCDAELPCELDSEMKDEIVDLIRKSSHLDPDDGETINISPAAWGNSALATNDGTGYAENPATGLAYPPNIVKRADFYRVLAEFWADGPHSETPPGHWNVIANYVSDNPLLVKKIAGVRPTVNDLEWDAKLYFALNSAVYDAAITAWDHKRKYETARPITLIRYMSTKGQSSDPLGTAYHPLGLPLVPGLIEVVTAASSAEGQRHAKVLGANGQPAVGQMAIYVWGGQPSNPVLEYTGAQWIRAIEFMPYMASTFVTPPFPGYLSGHSTFSRSAAEVLTHFTGDAYFPGGLGSFTEPQDSLDIEQGPTTEVTLQWARYYDGADQAGIARLLSGIHIRADDFGGRRAGSTIGIAAFEKAMTYFAPEPGDALSCVAAAATLAWIARQRSRAGDAHV